MDGFSAGGHDGRPIRRKHFFCFLLLLPLCVFFFLYLHFCCCCCCCCCCCLLCCFSILCWLLLCSAHIHFSILIYSGSPFFPLPNLSGKADWADWLAVLFILPLPAIAGDRHQLQQQQQQHQFWWLPPPNKNDVFSISSKVWWWKLRDHCSARKVMVNLW